MEIAFDTDSYPPMLMAFRRLPASLCELVQIRTEVD
jgi:hypothetical protein